MPMTLHGAFVVSPYSPNGTDPDRDSGVLLVRESDQQTDGGVHGCEHAGRLLVLVRKAKGEFISVWCVFR